MDIYYW